jgi:hypothetical protein
MKKTIRLTESELVGLVKRILSEQDFNKLGALGEITKKYIGETANLYKDPQNKKFVKQIHFEEITPEPDGRIQLMAKGETFPYYYYCNKPNVIVGIYDKNVIVFDESFEEIKTPSQRGVFLLSLLIVIMIRLLILCMILISMMKSVSEIKNNKLRPLPYRGVFCFIEHDPPK